MRRCGAWGSPPRDTSSLRSLGSKLECLSVLWLTTIENGNRERAVARGLRGRLIAGPTVIALRNRSASCDAPIPRKDRPNGDIIPSEESATLWLWAWPELLGWRRTINWLFSPVVGNTDYPGDVWGLDSAGSLLIVETKLARNANGPDPFADFVPYARRGRASELRNRWLRLVALEDQFMRDYSARLAPGHCPVGTHRGVLPYSRHRDAVWRWHQLFEQRIAPRFRDRGYHRGVLRSFRVREAAGNPPPTFVGLLATTHDGVADLSPRGRYAMDALTRIVGARRVFLRTIRAVRVGGRRLRISSWTPELGVPTAG